MMLTPEQEKMFEENEKLVYFTINNYIQNAGKYGLNDKEDIESMGKFALCKAIATYNGEKSKFSTYAISVIRNYLYNQLRDSKETSDNSLSISDEYVELNVNLAYDNITAKPEDEIVLQQGFDIIEMCGKKYGGIIEKGAEAIKLSMMGYNSSDIATMFGVEQNLVTAWMSRARKKLQKEPALLKLLNRA